MANVQNPGDNLGQGTQKKSPQQQDKWNSSTQKADRKPTDREYENESPETPFRPETPEREVPDVQGNEDDLRQ